MPCPGAGEMETQVILGQGLEVSTSVCFKLFAWFGEKKI